MRPLFARLALAVVLLAAVAPAARAQDFPPGTPADIRAIVQKMKSGQLPTPAELQRMQQWSQGMAERANDPTTVGSQFVPDSLRKGLRDGIPCDIRIDFHYTAAGQGLQQSGELAVDTKAMLFAAIDGVGDYGRAIVDTSQHASSFRFEPEAPNGTPTLAGSGHYAWTSSDGSTRTNGTASITHAAFGMMFATTGRGDALYPTGTGLAAHIHGEQHWHQNDGQSGTDAVDEDGLRDMVIQVPCPAENRRTLQPSEPTPLPVLVLSASKMIEAVRLGRMATVTGTEEFSFDDGGTRYAGNATLRITLRPSPVQLVVVPANSAIYSDWLPVPDHDTAPDGLYGEPYPLDVRIALRRPDGGKLETTGIDTIDVYLRQVSKLPGVCMNSPSGTDKQGRDLYFSPDQPRGVRPVDEQHVRAAMEPDSEAVVRIRARDTGAYGQVTATFAPRSIRATYPVTDREYLRVPADDNDNQVPDAWERHERIWGLNRPAMWDEEERPANMAATGDGLSLFEECRGFLLDDGGQLKFHRLSCDRRKLFVYLDPGPDKALWQQGVADFAAATDLNVLFVHSEAEMRPMPDGSAPVLPRWINFRETPWSKPQAAVWVRDKDANPVDVGYCAPIKGYSDLLPLRPVKVHHINVSRAKADWQMQRYYDWITPVPPAESPPTVTAGFDAAGIKMTPTALYLIAHLPEMTNRLVRWTTMHELGHAIGGRHHGVPEGNLDQDTGAGEGDYDCPMRYWSNGMVKTDLARFLAGQWNLLEAPAGTGWHFCTEDWHVCQIKP